MDKRAVIWDMDGVLVDTGPFHLRAWQRIFREQGKTLREEEFLQTFGMRNDDIVRKGLGELPPEEALAISQRKEAYFREEIQGRITAFPGVLALVEALRRKGFRQAVASSAPPENIRLILESLNIGHYFQAVISGDEIRMGKPSPDIFLKAAGALGVSPESCVVIEDAVTGVRAARNAGMKCIAVTNTSPLQSLGEADLVVASLAELSAETLETLAG